MRKRIVRSAGAWAAALFLTATGHSAEVIDRIVAVVGHHIILASELEAQLLLRASQQQLDLVAADERIELKHDLLDQMVNDRLMLIQAERDTSVKVNDRDVELELDKHVERIQSQFPAPEDFYKQLAREGLSLPELRRRYRREVRNQLLKQKLIEKRVRTVEISAPEVEAFYQEFGDSLPTRTAAVRMLDILYDVEVSGLTLDSVRRRAETILDSIEAGADFELMAQRYSDDPSGPGGGDLGWFGRNVMVPAFERAAFGLAIGEVSGVVQSRFGFHLIKSLERQGDRVHAAHILFRALPSDSDLAVAVAAVASIRERLLSGEDFAALAKQYSADSATAVAGGDLGWIPLASLPEPFASAISGHPAGTLLEPLIAEDGVHLIKIAERHDERPYDLALDRAEITELARRHKTGRVVDEWVARLRDEIYVDVRL